MFELISTLGCAAAGAVAGAVKGASIGIAVGGPVGAIAGTIPWPSLAALPALWPATTLATASTSGEPRASTPVRFVRTGAFFKEPGGTRYVHQLFQPPLRPVAVSYTHLSMNFMNLSAIFCGVMRSQPYCFAILRMLSSRK